jgi:drug/metabolite transporter (DMT)-like permease
LEILPFLAALMSAIAHASWNAAARSRADSSAAVTTTVMMAGAISIPALFWVGFPPADAWPWLVLGIVFNIVTLRILVAIYRMMPFAMAYPMLRGTIPLAVTAFNIALLPFGMPSVLGIIGILMVSSGVILLGFSGHRQEKIGWKPIALAILGGISAAAYVITDVKGIAATGSPLPYGVTAAIINAIAMPLFLRANGAPFSRIFNGQLLFGFLASFVSMGSYVLFLYALSQGPIGAASAMRETSVLFALGISMIVLKEKVGALRWFACGLAFAGAALLRLA